MTMAFTPSEFQQVKFFVCLSVANKLLIPNAEFKSSEALQNKISTANPGLGQALSKFLTTYNQWYQFHLDIDAAQKSGTLSSVETAEHVRLVEARDGARTALIEALKSVSSH
jgi:hypothetical protein